MEKKTLQAGYVVFHGLAFLGHGKPLFIDDEGGLRYAMVMHYLGRLATHQNKHFLENKQV